jgi:N,N'-diacetylchitobiose transport system substrate-binding protein
VAPLKTEPGREIGQVTFTRSAAAVGAVVALVGTAAGIAGCGSSGGGNNSSSSGSAVPSKLVVWRMGNSVASQVTWMDGVVSQWKKANPKYKHTDVVLDWIPWTSAGTDWTNALTSGKGGPDITEMGNTQTPGLATQGALANITSDVHSWSLGSQIIAGNLANDTVSGNVYGVPWFGGVRGIWYNKSEFATAGISTPPTTWAQLVSDAKLLMQKNKGTYGIGAPTDDTNAIVSFIWGAGGQVAVQQNGKWVAQLTSPASEAGIKFYADLLLTEHVSSSKYIGETELGLPGASGAGGTDEDFALGKLDMYIDGPWAESSLLTVSKKNESQWASFPIPSENGPNPAPAFAGGSDLGVWVHSKYQTADWSLISYMDNVSNATSFANSQGFFPEFSSQLTSPTYASSQLLSGFAKAAGYTQISPLNSKNWGTADTSQYNIIPNMMKALESGAPFASTVAKANTELQNVLNTGSETG